MKEDKLRGTIVFFANCDTFFLPSHTKGDFFMSSLRSRRAGSSVNTKKLIIAALFSALAYAATLLTAWIRVAGFLTFDAKDTLVTIAGLVLGPVYAIVISFIVSLIEIIFLPETGFWGFLMNFLSTAAFSAVCALIYKYKKNIKGACVGLIASVFSMTAMMVLLNLVVTPIYTGMPTATIASMIPTLFLPFNFTKAVLNAALVLILYKPISRALKATKMLESRSTQGVVDKKSQLATNIIIFVIGLALIAASVAVFVFVLGGDFTFG